jgi:ABC-type transporter MlaC component
MKVYIFVILAFFMFQSTAIASTSDPVVRTNDLIQAFKNVKPTAEGKTLSPEDQKHNDAAFLALDAFFDFNIFLDSMTVPFRAKFSEAQYKAYKTDFKQVIRFVAYPDSGAFLTQAKLTITPGAKAGTLDVNLLAFLEEEDLETEITFHWKDMAGSLRIIDVSFDGTSLVKDYQNQFGRIIKKEGVEGLMKKVSERLKKEQTRSTPGK